MAFARVCRRPAVLGMGLKAKLPGVAILNSLFSVNNFVNKFLLKKWDTGLISAACVDQQTNEKYSKRNPLEVFPY